MSKTINFYVHLAFLCFLISRTCFMELVNTTQLFSFSFGFNPEHFANICQITEIELNKIDEWNSANSLFK